MFFGVIVISDSRFFSIFEDSNVLVADVYQPLVSVFRNPLVLACAVPVLAHVSCVSATVAHLRFEMRLLNGFPSM